VKRSPDTRWRKSHPDSISKVSQQTGLGAPKSHYAHDATFTLKDEGHHEQDQRNAKPMPGRRGQHEDMGQK
jgi:hypothetical protein